MLGVVIMLDDELVLYLGGFVSRLNIAGTGGLMQPPPPRVFRELHANGSADRHETWYT